MELIYQKSRTDREVIKQIQEIIEQHFECNLCPYDARKGAIDLVSYIEIALIYSMMRAVDGFLEGLVGKKNIRFRRINKN